MKPVMQVPSAELIPRDDLSFSGSRSGEDALMNQLSKNVSSKRLGINDLRGMGQPRGIRVNPADTHQVLIGKIVDSATPEELDRFEQAAKNGCNRIIPGANPLVRPPSQVRL